MLNGDSKPVMGRKKGCNLLIRPRPVSLHRYQRAGLLQCHHLCGNRHLIEDKSLVRLASDTPVGGDINENNLTLSQMGSHRIRAKTAQLIAPVRAASSEVAALFSGESKVLKIVPNHSIVPTSNIARPRLSQIIQPPGRGNSATKPGNRATTSHGLASPTPIARKMANNIGVSLVSATVTAVPTKGAEQGVARNGCQHTGEKITSKTVPACWPRGAGQ